ncbi:RNA polymerase sigma factor [Dyadobacter fanqingshengii]|uniref:Sigma-70 family RNA polymerase sigma factor n=1 Tax=Dyadobacter fanqingshengii TaxID=2906443 RepID=A0A9X1T894_9BACT|nr:sigma-70 family RNA polymerase sigma factor [Dyadobacter fanqingshengii]MCF0039198.1 sigma-70 family RNA polymerase sigma factor [Dyadobacter fanqingshengii]USJ33983.1 sigma-70 family RNA polymerase sigma factor [Dyadobacter fanqingshengii]
MKPHSQPPQSSDDNALWQQFLLGDVAAFEQLMSSHFRVLFRYGCKFSKDQEFVKDSVQDLFLHLWEKRGSLSADVAVKPYLMASLRRLMHRSVSSKSWVGEGNVEQVDEAFDLEFSVEQQYINNESTLVRTRQLEKLLMELPKRQKEVIYLKFFQELSREQISEIMAVSPQTVSNLLQIAIKQLKKHWKAEFLTFFLIHLFI